MLFKRVIDVLFAAGALIITAPLQLILALCIKLSDGGPILYRQTRLGINGEEFSVMRFRTMRHDAPAAKHQSTNQSPVVWADKRMTTVGRFLEVTGLNEIPQLWNILRGDMSIVGPRPRFDWESDRFGSALPTVERVKGGLTGAWQVNGRSHLTFEERLALEVEYATRRTIRGDLAIMAKTALQMVKGSPGAY